MPPFDVGRVPSGRIDTTKALLCIACGVFGVAVWVIVVFALVAIF